MLRDHKASEKLAEKSKVGAINNAINGIRWMHVRQGYESPTYHPFLQMAAEGAKGCALLTLRLTKKNQ